jgi:hypothetical protein
MNALNHLIVNVMQMIDPTDAEGANTDDNAENGLSSDQ